MAAPDDPLDAPVRDLAQLDERRLRLRCGACGAEFEAADTGADPLVVPCVACGVEGIIPRPRRRTEFTLVRRGRSCRSCGAALPPAATKCPACAESVQAGQP